MKLRAEIRNIIIEIICLLYVLLFVYAAVSKLLDFENFQVQLGQSPLLSSYAVWVSYLVPVIELLIVILLIIPKFRITGLYASLSLMTMFSVYIIIILNFSSFVPCSCGGILEKMTWKIHLVFNLFFVVLAFLALLFQKHYRTGNKKESNERKLRWYVSLNIIFSVFTIVVLFLSSEQIMHYKNPFIRRFPKHPIVQDTVINLTFNSYYFAGADHQKIYLGNYSSPLHITTFDKRTKVKNTFKIKLDSRGIRFSSVRVKVIDSSFYLMDGTVPAVYSGSTLDWDVKKELKGLPYFTLAEPADRTKVILRSSNGRNSEHSLGTFNEADNPKVKYNSGLLKKQIDGIFDTDGTLVFDAKTARAVYVYYYRNEYIVIDNNANLKFTGHTIDTISKAKIKVAHLKNNTERKLSAPALTVNPHTAICENLLFVNSKVSGRFESEKLWEQAYIIDVYDLERKAYLMSFALYKIEDKRLNSFYVTQDYLYAIMDNELGVYRLRDLLRNEINSVKSKKK
ncbi:MauE/DoxX family redox-associated membrane protein [Flavobacterium sp. 140616W15]|uniref:MauE/DoxX family redox-associated membrane protein n=1 Tax=Flavobacterium sp. 140616W15 TaxID=2478552 RepID=UPI000F0C506C|nr:MauE/DoxX family redox-associated membrane protein [Flavobacterium sp. 140616W15]AYN03594.1 hypothetical protein EAG11_04970 [Flavobacterium sp. 140616W15]